MDPLAKAVKRKGWVKEEVIADPEGPIYKIDIKGDEDGYEPPAPTVSARPSPQPEFVGGFGGPDEEEEVPSWASRPIYADDDPSSDKPPMPGEGGYSEDAAQEKARIDAAKAKWKAEFDAGVPDPEWNEKYAEPDQEQTDKVIHEWLQAPEGQGVVDKYGMLDEEVDRIGQELLDADVEAVSVSPTYLRKKYGLSDEQAIALSLQLAERFGSGYEDPLADDGPDGPPSVDDVYSTMVEHGWNPIDESDPKVRAYLKNAWDLNDEEIPMVMNEIKKLHHDLTGE